MKCELDIIEHRLTVYVCPDASGCMRTRDNTKNIVFLVDIELLGSVHSASPIDI
jgi:hypothetical protein